MLSKHAITYSGSFCPASEDHPGRIFHNGWFQFSWMPGILCWLSGHRTNNEIVQNHTPSDTIVPVKPERQRLSCRCHYSSLIVPECYRLYAYIIRQKPSSKRKTERKSRTIAAQNLKVGMRSSVPRQSTIASFLFHADLVPASNRRPLFVANRLRSTFVECQQLNGVTSNTRYMRCARI